MDPIQADELPAVRRMGDGVALGLWRDNTPVATADVTPAEARRLAHALLAAARETE